MTGKETAQLFSRATRLAARKALSEGRAITVKRGRRIISITDKGQETVVRTLDKAYVRCHVKTCKISSEL